MQAFTVQAGNLDLKLDHCYERVSGVCACVALESCLSACIQGMQEGLAPLTTRSSEIKVT